MGKIEMVIKCDDDKILLYDMMKNLKDLGCSAKLEFHKDKVIIHSVKEK